MFRHVIASQRHLFKSALIPTRRLVQRSSLPAPNGRHDSATHQQRHLSSQPDTNVSSLYVSNAIGQHTAPVELDLNIEEIMQNIEEFKSNLELRGLTLDIDNFSKMYQRMVEIESEIVQIEQKRREIKKKMVNILDGENSDKNLEAELRSNGKRLKEDLKILTKELNGVQEYVTLTALNFPNRISKDAPLKTETVREYGELREGASHMDLIRDLTVIDKPVSPNMAYLRGDLAILEEALMSYFIDRLNQAGYVPVSAPDLFKTLVVDGCGENRDDHFRLELKEGLVSTKATGKALDFNKLEHSQFLSGVSPMSMAAFFCRCITDFESLPLKFQCYGRRYKPTNEHSGDLLNLHQNSGIHVFIASEKENCLISFEEIRDLVWDVYRDLDLPLKLCEVGARSLERQEISRYDLQCHFPSLNDYRALGSVSLVGDYISRRLMMRIGGKDDRFRFLHVTHCDVISVQKLMAAMLENHWDSGSERVRVPGCLREHWIGPVDQNGLFT